MAAAQRPGHLTVSGSACMSTADRYAFALLS